MAHDGQDLIRRAEEARAVAATMPRVEGKKILMLAIARCYERLAAWAVRDLNLGLSSQDASRDVLLGERYPVRRP
jgi:hypothetical protein